MTRKLIALATVASISAASLAPVAVNAMGMEFNMLTGAVFNELRSRSIPPDNIDSLSLSQIAVIKSILDSDDPEGTKTQRIRTVVMGS